MHEIECSWKGDMAFLAQVNGHELVLDADEAVGGHDEGPRPKPLILVALAGCSGMDVVSILKKMREPVSWFNMKVRGELTEEHPKTYSSITLVYEFKVADGLKDENVRKAVELSQDRYCGVSALLKKAIPVKHEIAYL
ncbi:MAG TPA: osmotically inducible protein C [Spirochaetaceae bacterium]|jgi:putative redox protein|nr:osmotically inducible protein C [Spirochaetaceae bacterium]